MTNGPDSGQLYAAWDFDHPRVYMLEDSYVNNNGLLHSGPQFSSDEDDRKFATFDGKNQYAEAPASIADFGQLTVDMAVNWSGGNSQRLFDFGTGNDECFYLNIADAEGKPSLVAVHDGKTYRLGASETVPTNRWAVVRVELNSSNASICLDGKQIAQGPFPFRPRDVFIGDRPEGNFIACGRNKTDFFKGSIDHFRVYRTTHKNFDAIGKPDPNLQQLAADWVKRQAEAQKKINENSPFKNFPNESAKLNRRREQLLNTSDKLTELNERQRTAAARKSEIDRQMQEQFNKLESTTTTNKEIAEIRQTINTINHELRQSGQYAAAGLEIEELNKTIRQVDQEIRQSDDIVALLEQSKSQEQKKREIEQSVRELPELKKALEAHQNEKDNTKRDELRRKYDSMYQEKLATSVEHSTAETMRREFQDRHRTTIDKRLESNLQWTAARDKLRVLQQKHPKLLEKARADHPELSKLEKTLRLKQQTFEEAKQEYLKNEPRRGPTGDEYEKLVGELDAVSRAIPEERARLLKVNEKELSKIGARLYEMGYQRKMWRYDGMYLPMKEAGLGRNPLHNQKEPPIVSLHEKIEYKTSADWEYRTSQELGNKVPPIMQQWLDRVRGY